MKTRFSIQTKLILVICIIMIPLNIVLIFLTYDMVRSAQERLIAVYENEMNIIQIQLASFVEAELKELEVAGRATWSTLSDLSVVSTLEQQNMMIRLKEIWQKIDIVEGAYLKLDEINYAYCTYNTEVLHILQIDEIKEVLLDTDLKEVGFGQWMIWTESGEGFWSMNINRTGYSFGLMIPMTEVLAIAARSCNEGEFVYLEDFNGNIFIATEEIDIIEYTKKMDTIQLFSLDFENPGFRIVKAIPLDYISATVPALMRGLQYFAIIAIMIIPALWLAIRQVVLKPMRRFNKAMKEIEKDNITYRIDEQIETSKEFHYMGYRFNMMAEQIKELRIQKYETEIEKLKVETDNLRLQVNPHLLLNSLNMICNLAKINETKIIQSYTMNLAEYFRYALRKSDELVSLHSEMSFVKSFLDIQKVRFPNTFTSVYDVDDGLDEMLIPPLLIQNFVENSFKYALKMGEIIEVLILIKRSGDRASISIIDTGNGIEKDILEKLRNGEIIENKTGKHIGIWNIRRRLRLAYGDDFELGINSTEGEGTQIWIQIPITY